MWGRTRPGTSVKLLRRSVANMSKLIEERKAAGMDVEHLWGYVQAVDELRLKWTDEIRNGALDVPREGLLWQAARSMQKLIEERTAAGMDVDNLWGYVQAIDALRLDWTDEIERGALDVPREGA